MSVGVGDAGEVVVGGGAGVVGWCEAYGVLRLALIGVGLAWWLVFLPALPVLMLVA